MRKGAVIYGNDDGREDVTRAECARESFKLITSKKLKWASYLPTSSSLLVKELLTATRIVISLSGGLLFAVQRFPSSHDIAKLGAARIKEWQLLRP